MPFKLDDFKPGVAADGLRLGMSVSEAVSVLGPTRSRYPRPGRKFDRRLHENEAFMCWKAAGVDVAFGAIDDLARTTARSRVKAVHVHGRKVRSGRRLVTRAEVRALHGEPDDAGGHIDTRPEMRGTGARVAWEWYEKGLQATYDQEGRLVSICVAKAKARRKRTRQDAVR